MAMQRLKITECLGESESAECIGLFRNRKIRLHGVHELKKESAVGATLVQLPGGV